jgi:hypothetical protein
MTAHLSFSSARPTHGKSLVIVGLPRLVSVRCGTWQLTMPGPISESAAKFVLAFYIRIGNNASHVNINGRSRMQ